MRILVDTGLAAQIDAELAVPQPERLMHVFGSLRPDGSLLLSHGLMDESAEASYSHVRASSEAEQAIAAIESTDRVQYFGVIHSHPESVPEPSGPDGRALADLLRRNPHLPVAVVGVVVGRTTGRRGNHVLRLPSGELSLHVGIPAEDRLQPAVVSRRDSGVDFWKGISARQSSGSLAAMQFREVLIVGAGSLGSAVAEQLVRGGVPRFTLIDPDLVEAVNLGRTVYRHDDIGRFKVEALRDRLKSINPDVQVLTRTDPVARQGVDELRRLLSGTDLALGLADDMGAMSILDVLLHETDTAGIFSGVYRAAMGGDVVTVVPGLTSCWRCTVGSRAGSSDLRPDVDYGTGRLEGELALGADISVISVLTSRVALGYLGMLDGSDKLLDPVVMEGRNYLQVGTAPGFFESTGVFADAPAQHAFQSIWARNQGDPECDECGAVSRELDEREPEPIQESVSPSDGERRPTYVRAMLHQFSRWLPRLGWPGTPSIWSGIPGYSLVCTECTTESSETRDDSPDVGAGNAESPVDAISHRSSTRNGMARS